MRAHHRPSRHPRPIWLVTRGQDIIRVVTDYRRRNRGYRTIRDPSLSPSSPPAKGYLAAAVIVIITVVLVQPPVVTVLSIVPPALIVVVVAAIVVVVVTIITSSVAVSTVGNRGSNRSVNAATAAASITGPKGQQTVMYYGVLETSTMMPSLPQSPRFQAIPINHCV